MALNDSMSHSGLHLQVDAAGDGFQIPVSPLDSPVPGCSNGGSLLLTPEFGTPRMSPHRSSLVKDGTRRCVEKKSVSFGSMPKDRKISNVGDCIRVMQNGSEMVKIRSSTRRYRRVFSLDTDCSHLRWSPSNKKPHKAKIPVEMVREIRNGRPADNSARGTGNEIVVSDFPEECIFSVVWGDQYETLDLLANSADEANIWVTGLTALLSGNALAGADNKFYQLRDIWLTEQFSETANEHTLNAEGEELSLPWLSECQTIKLARVLNPNIFPSRLRQKIKELDCSKLEHAKGRITCNDFLDLYKDVSTRPEIYFLMVRLANKDYLTEADFQAFLENEQGICGVDSNYVSQLFNQYETSPQHTKAGIMGIDGFTAYLLSSNCTIFDPQHSEVCQDMTEPITHYFISASHNTYLIQDQLKGPSSIEGYIKALRDGCRFIESMTFLLDGGHRRECLCLN